MMIKENQIIPRNRLDAFMQALIPPALVMLLIVSIIELFYNVKQYYFLIDIFDLIVIMLFAIDLSFRWKDEKNLKSFFRKYYLDIIATIPFNLIFLRIDYLVFVKALRGVRVASRFARLTRYIRLIRIVVRAPRFFRIRHKIDNSIARKKTQPHEREMKKTLGFKVILLVTINSIMGTGIWFLTAAGAKYAGPASLISWGILSAIAIYISMCFSELTAMFPKAGGVYEFAKQSYGKFWSFVVGWTTSISGSLTISMLLLGALQYMIPLEYSEYYVPIAIFFVFIFSFIAYKGMQTSTYMLVGFALLTIVTIIGIIVPGFFSMNLGNLDPFFVFPGINILLAIFFIAETFFGWESAIFLSAETKNPKKMMPKALILGTIVIACFALLLSVTAMGVIPWQDYGQSVAPLKDLGGVYFGEAGSIIVMIFVSISIIGAVASWIVAAPRLLMALAEDKLFFVHFAKLHPKHKSPYVSIVFQAIVISILVFIGSGSYEILLHLLIPLILILYSALLLSVVILRYKKPGLERPFKVPFGKIGPLFTVVFMLFLLFMYVKETHHAWHLLRISLSLIMFGIPVYLAIELFYDQQYVIMRRKFIVHMMHLFHFMPRQHYTKAINYLKPFSKDSVIIDFDSRAGRLARKLSAKGLSFNKIYEIVRSKEEMDIIREKMSDKLSGEIDVHYTKGMELPLKYLNEKADRFFSYNTIGYIDDIPSFLKKMKKVLKKDGKFCFYVNHNMINLTPNALIVQDKNKLQNIFSEQGFDMKYFRKKGLFKEEIYLYGKNSD